MDHLEFYGLALDPFSNAPVSRFYYDSVEHSHALVRLKHAVGAMKGLAVLSGGIGTGKTTLARRLLDALDEREYEAALLVVIHRDVTPEWMLHRIATQLGVPDPSREKLQLLSQLCARLIQIFESGRKAVVLIDEAQMLGTRELMEELRGLLNLEVPERKLLSFVMFGLPEIEDNLKMDLPLAQRVALRVSLSPLDLESTDAYVRHRLRLAGATRTIIDGEAIRVLFEASGGVPRIINTICDNALFEGALARAPTIGPELIRRIAKNLGLSCPEPISHSDYVAAPGASHLPTLVPGSPLSPPPPRPTAPSPSTAAALEEIDRVLAALGRLN